MHAGGQELAMHDGRYDPESLAGNPDLLARLEKMKGPEAVEKLLQTRLRDLLGRYQERLKGARSWARKLEILAEGSRAVGVLLTVAVLLVAVVALDLVFGLTRPAAVGAFLLLLALAATAIAIQFSQKCPRCGYRLGFQTRLLLPERCGKCDVELL